jgi:hypothetical protein
MCREHKHVHGRTDVLTENYSPLICRLTFRIAHRGAARNDITTLLAIAGLCAAFTNNWHAAAAVWNAAFLGKWVECWLLEKVLVDVQLALEAM